MGRLWKNSDETPEGKYLVQRRDGTIPEWPYFVLGAADPAAPAALIAYAGTCRALGMDRDYVDDIRALAIEFGLWRLDHVSGDPDAPRHRQDDPSIVELMRQGHGS